MAHTWAGALSTNRSQCNALRTLSRSVVSRARCGRGRRFGLDVTGRRRRYNVERDTPSASQASAVCPIRPPAHRPPRSIVLVVVDRVQGDPGARRLFFGSLASFPPEPAGAGSRAFSRSSSLIRGASAFAFRPRFLDVNPALAISSRCRRQLDRCDEYSPSRRRSAATSPSPLQASASRTIRSLYSALKRRRFAFSLTSGSRTPAAAPRSARSPVALTGSFRPRRRHSLNQRTHL